MCKIFRQKTFLWRVDFWLAEQTYPLNNYPRVFELVLIQDNDFLETSVYLTCNLQQWTKSKEVTAKPVNCSSSRWLLLRDVCGDMPDDRWLPLDTTDGSAGKSCCQITWWMLECSLDYLSISPPTYSMCGFTSGWLVSVIDLTSYSSWI